MKERSAKNDLKQVLPEISKVIDEQSDPEKFKDQITSIVKMSMIKSKTSRIYKPKTTKLVAKANPSAKIDKSQIQQTKTNHEPETILIAGKKVRDQTDSDNDSDGHKSKRHKLDEVVNPQNRQPTRTSGKKCPRNAMKVHSYFIAYN